MIVSSFVVLLGLISFLFIRTTVNTVEEDGKLEGVILKVLAASLQV